jgi:hypothetical protein
VIGIVQSFSAYPDPIVDLAKLTQFALDASAQFLNGIDSGAEAESLLTELQGG